MLPLKRIQDMENEEIRLKEQHNEIQQELADAQKDTDKHLKGTISRATAGNLDAIKHITKVKHRLLRCKRLSNIVIIVVNGYIAVSLFITIRLALITKLY